MFEINDVNVIKKPIFCMRYQVCVSYRVASLVLGFRGRHKTHSEDSNRSTHGAGFYLKDTMEGASASQTTSMVLVL